MSIDLFSFDFSEEVTEENIYKKFKEVQQISKDRENCFFIGTEEVPNMVTFIDEFENRGWVEKRGTNGFLIPDEFVDFHTPDEIIESFQKSIDQVTQKENVCWYEDILPVINFASPSYRYKNEEEKEEIYRRKKEVIKETAFQFGLKHFINVPKARGHKMYNFDTKWKKENLLPLIAKHVIPIQDYDEMEQFFRTYFFFVGRRDWHSQLSVPYPNIFKLLPSYLAIASLCEATEEKSVQLVLDFAGRSFGGNIDYSLILYPEGWSWTRYENSLTDEDIQKINQDKERLRNLHS